MTLANMRENSVRSLWVVCPLCHHEAVVNVDSLAADVAVPAFGPRMITRLTGCRRLPLRALDRAVSKLSCAHPPQLLPRRNLF
jgi:hypothetical protein